VIKTANSYLWLKSSSAKEGLPNPVNGGIKWAFIPNLSAGFDNPAEHHGDSRELAVIKTAGSFLWL